MELKSEYPVMVFKNEYNGKTYYKIGFSNKKQDGTRENAYMDARFKGDVCLDNQTNIYVKNGFMSFYLKDKQPIWYMVITEYEKVADVIKETSYTNLKQDEIDCTLDLPF